MHILCPEGGVPLEIKTDMTDLLEMMDRPAFCVSDGRILAANRAALARMVPLGDPILPLLGEDQEDYAQFTQGCLYLSLTISGQRYGASVTKLGGTDVFSLESEDMVSSLQPLGLAARELRDPLNRILSITDSLFPRLDQDADAADQMARVNRGLYQMLRLVNNMSSAAAPLAPHLELRDVTAVAQEVFEQAAQLCSSVGVTLGFSNHSAAIYSLIDTGLLERGIYNILSNSLKHTPAGGTIDARLTRRGRRFYLTIADSGTGIDPGISPNVFRRYLREPALEDASQGIGLGMKLVHSAATAHGGTVLLEQPKEGGVRVTISLPIRQNSDTIRSHALRVDYAGERSPALIELSDSLPPEFYAPHPKE